MQAEGARGWVVISIADTGIGIGPDDLQHLFSRFYRVSSADTQGIGGTGLGLNITQVAGRAARRHDLGGERAGRGSTFSFCLPLFRRSRVWRRKSRPWRPAIGRDSWLSSPMWRARA